MKKIRGMRRPSGTQCRCQGAGMVLIGRGCHNRSVLSEPESSSINRQVVLKSSCGRELPPEKFAGELEEGAMVRETGKERSASLPRRIPWQHVCTHLCSGSAQSAKLNREEPYAHCHPLCPRSIMMSAYRSHARSTPATPTPEHRTHVRTDARDATLLKAIPI